MPVGNSSPKPYICIAGRVRTNLKRREGIQIRRQNDHHKAKLSETKTTLWLIPTFSAHLTSLDLVISQIFTCLNQWSHKVPGSIYVYIGLI